MQRGPSNSTVATMDPAPRRRNYLTWKPINMNSHQIDELQDGHK